VNLKQLEVFYAIMQAGSVTAAARSLNVTQPAVSNVLKHTEQQLKFKLFERIGGRLHPTPEASDLLPDVNEIFGRVGTLNRVVQEMRDGKTGRLVIATSPTLVHAFLPRAIALFRSRSPAVHVSIQSLPTPLVIERVARREVDMGIVYAPVTDPGVDAEKLVVTEIACVVRKQHPLARKRHISAEDIASESVISLGATTRIGTLIEDECRKAGVPTPDVAIEASSSLAACLLVSEGAGVALIDKSTSLSGKFGDLAFRSFRPKICVEVQLIYPRDRPRSRATVQLSEQLRRLVPKEAR
jgi:DNA-binding transcriptional LysR family regulator